MRCFCIFGLFVLPLSAEPPSLPDNKEAAYPALERFVEVLEAVRERHPDLDKVDYERLINHALDGMLSSVDRHSSFIHPEMKQLIGSDGTLDNEVKSLGLSIGKNSDGLFVSAVEKNGPTDLAGILPGSKILKINGEAARDLIPGNAIEILSLPPGETTEITLENPERPGEVSHTLAHRFVEERSLVLSELMKDHPEIGYLRLAQFGPNCAREIEAALDELEDKGMKSLILDLRENGGGDLHETVKILGLLVPPDTAVVSVRERGKPEEFLKTPERQRRQRNYPVAVLVDRNSASASELTAGALQDLKRAKIIGEKTYGKGSVQNIIPMGNGTALRLTIATYHTPSGNTPHLKGITPETIIAFTDADRENFRKAGRISSLTPDEKSALEKWQDPAILSAVGALQ